MTWSYFSPIYTIYTIAVIKLYVNKFFFFIAYGGNVFIKMQNIQQKKLRQMHVPNLKNNNKSAKVYKIKMVVQMVNIY